MHAAVFLYPYFCICCPRRHGMDLFLNHLPVSSRLDPSRRRKSVLHVRVASSPILRWSRSSKHFLPHSCSFLKLYSHSLMPLLFLSMTASSVGYGSTTLVLSSALLLLLLCNLAHPACFRKALFTLFVHTERTVVFPFCTSNVMRSVGRPTFL